MPRCVAAKSKPGIIVLLNRKRQGPVHVEEVSRQAGLSKLLRSECFVLPARPEKMAEQLHVYGLLIEASRSYRLTYPAQKIHELVSTIQQLHAL